ncbi:hypothetical protein SAMN06265338_101387 [Rhodoblastus acidophilus]|uniref:Uncharacterized protein n=1 Tax=Rhodoblastus acidophilus TaxID=1074 RepID=A0A212Q4P0_RHOAC|nr:hypothetical protein [Rhodoblastus acidophilus]PPQ36377.1 hypothetical protein CKO16_18245 [Rhodoblastus acidophilus]RAI16646.1 hypothetical protein CH337_20315 [Rhodoblastus acidophilus]SNB54276.1 hypothetical protein SAMN06265338_101387 [Rhodoblastus acidophilus]
MCDYSLEFYATRQAQENEVYVTTRFPSGSMGFAAPGDCTTAVCVTYGTKMTLENLPPELQHELGIGPIESVVFARIEEGLHHDGVRFSNGRTVLLHRLGVGVLGSMVSDTALPERKEAKAEAQAEIKTERQIPVEPAE